MTQTAQTPDYPPYGYMVAEYEPPQPKAAPIAWRNDVPFPNWHDNMVELLSEVLWPRYDKAAQQWTGAAAGFMHDLTLADFALFPRLRPMIDEASPVPGKKHVEIFRLEDEGDVRQDKVLLLDRSVDASFKLYVEGKASAAQVRDLVENYIDRLGAHAGDIDLYLKIDMQRPRAFQMSWLLGQDFSHQLAKSAVTPALISGHCFQLLMGGAAAYVRAGDLWCSASAVEAIAQHTVDAGDRRVFAGVHYASDNISSWLTGLLACPHLFPTEAAARWLWDAISGRSAVYRLIREAIDQGTGDPYVPSMTLLEKIGTGQIATVAEALDSLRAPPTAVAA